MISRVQFSAILFVAHHQVQSLESMKLQFTADAQLAKQEVQDNPEDKLMDQNLRGIQKRLHEITQEITEALEEVKYLQADLLPSDDEEDRVNR